MDEKILDRTADNLLTLLFIHHKHLLRAGEILNGVQEAQFRILGLLMKEGTMSMSSLGNRLFISKPYMTNLVDSLIRDDLVERNPDLKDRRVINITITERGIRHMNHAKDRYRECVKSIISQLENHDLTALCSSAERVVSILTKITDTQACPRDTPERSITTPVITGSEEKIAEKREAI
jgi:DNA-binding MarR family transcriptional regulator